MSLPSVFNQEVHSILKKRIGNVQPNSTPDWGKMSAGQMMAHCCVTYEYIFEKGKYKPAGGVKKWLLRTLVKPSVVNEKPYPRNSKTAPDFKQTSSKVFEMERARLIGFIDQVYDLGEEHFDGLDYHSFGVMNKTEFSNMFYKHLDHHLSQFGV